MKVDGKVWRDRLEDLHRGLAAVSGILRHAETIEAAACDVHLWKGKRREHAQRVLKELEEDKKEAKRLRAILTLEILRYEPQYNKCSLANIRNTLSRCGVSDSRVRPEGER